MKRLPALLLLCALALVTLVACGQRSSAAEESRAAASAAPGEHDAPAEAQDQSGEEKVYVCPMHCVPEGQTEEYTSHSPGQCPVCGMDLVEKR